MKYRKTPATDEAVQRAMQEIMTRPTVAVWPTAGLACGLGRSAAYAAAAKGHIPVERFGGVKRAISAKLRQKLGISTEVA
jgi:hypothetical protein